MRRMILTPLVLASMTALSYAASPSEPKPSAPSANATADLTAAAAAAAGAGAVILYNPTLVHEYVRAEMTKAYLDGSANLVGSRQATFLGRAPEAVTPARIVQTAGLELGSEELAAMPAVTEVTVKAQVDTKGFAHGVHVTTPVGMFLDAKVVEAVQKYRFQPAMADNSAVNSDVTVTMKIAKPE